MCWVIHKVIIQDWRLNILSWTKQPYSLEPRSRDTMCTRDQTIDRNAMGTQDLIIELGRRNTMLPMGAETGSRNWGYLWSPLYTGILHTYLSNLSVMTWHYMFSTCLYSSFKHPLHHGVHSAPTDAGCSCFQKDMCLDVWHEKYWVESNIYLERWNMVTNLYHTHDMIRNSRRFTLFPKQVCLRGLLIWMGTRG